MVSTSAALLDLLFEPAQIGSLHLPNRIVMAPMTRSFSPNGVPGDEVAAYYRRRAEGGVGLIVTEGTWVPHPAASNDDAAPDFFGQAALAGWSKVVQDVHAAGGRIIPQLWHVGLVRKQPTLDTPEGLPARADQIGPSGLTGGHGWEPTPDRAPMTQAQIDAVIDAFATAAQSAQALGFDGVELHGGHGYIIDQFLWSRTNRRTDRYGGDPRSRAVFAAEIVAEIRRRTGKDFPIVLRLSQWKSHDYEARIADTPQELEALLAPIVEAGVDAFDCSQRRFWEPTFAGSDLNLAGWAKRLSGKPSVTVGSVGLDVDFMTSLFVKGVKPTTQSLDALLKRLADREFDLVAVGRALIMDPAWPKTIRSAQEAETPTFTARALKTLW